MLKKELFISLIIMYVIICFEACGTVSGQKEGKEIQLSEQQTETVAEAEQGMSEEDLEKECIEAVKTATLDKNKKQLVKQWICFLKNAVHGKPNYRIMMNIMQPVRGGILNWVIVHFCFLLQKRIMGIVFCLIHLPIIKAVMCKILLRAIMRKCFRIFLMGNI